MAEKHWTLITGASEGLGRHFVRLAAKDGRNVVLTARSEDKLETAAEMARAAGVEAVVIPADLSKPGAAKDLWAKASEGRRIDVLVNNAGLGRNGAFGEETYGGFERERLVMQVNMVALTELMHAAVGHMKAQGGGRILNVASAAGFLPGPGMAVYHATKAYVLHLSEAVASELANSNVTVSALCPGATETAFFEDAEMHDARLINMMKPAPADAVAEEGWLGMRIGKRVIVPGLMNKVFAFLPRLLPRALTTRLATLFLERG